MTARLRVLFVSADKRLLVIDKMGGLDVDQVRAVVEGTKTPATDGALIFPFEVDIPDGSTEGTVIHADERVALRWAFDALNRMPIGDEPGQLRPDSQPARNIGTLRLLLDRIEQPS